MSRTTTERCGAPEKRLEEAAKQIELASEDISNPTDVCDLAEAMEIIEVVKDSLEEDTA